MIFFSIFNCNKQINKSFVFLFGSFLLLFISAKAWGFTKVEDRSTLKILNPALKDIQTLKLKLNNDLKVLIISDPRINISACALAVNTGSWDDPEKYPGMAHFVEHMLFQGSANYPSREDDFGNFLASHHGNRNAYTSFLETVYYFYLPTQSVEEALRRFSDFFIFPLFKQDSVSKELHAVDEEYKMHMANDSVRIFFVEKELANPDHPHHRFNIGSQEILSRITQKDLFSWYQSNYSANRMALVFYTNLSLEKAAGLIEKNFSHLKNSHLQRLSIDLPFLSKKQKGRIVYIEPLKDLKKLNVQWEVDPKFAKDASALKFLSYILNRSDKHSLLTILKKQQLIKNCLFSEQILGKNHALFTAEFNLTSYGLKNINSILAYLEDAFKKLKTDAINQQLFVEMNRTKALEYSYQSRQKPQDLVMEYSSMLLKEKLKNFPDKAFLSSAYSQKKLKQVLDSLNLQDGFFEVIAKFSKTYQKPQFKEKWMQSQYALTAFPEKWLEKPKSMKQKASFDLPDLNPFLPQDLSLEKIENPSPVKIIDNAYQSIYFQQSTNIQEPKTNFTLNFYSPLINESVESALLTDLFIYHFQKEKECLIQEAALAGIDFGLDKKNLKLIFTISGFSEKADLFLKRLLDTKELAQISPTAFQEHKKELLKHYQNSQKNLALKQALQEAHYLLIKKYPDHILAQKIVSISYEKYQYFIKNLFQKNFLEGILVGNLTSEKALNLARQVQKQLNFKPAKKQEIVPAALIEQSFLIYRPIGNQGQALSLIIDQGAFSYSKRALQMLSNSILNSAFFYQLRSEEKVGYIAQTQDIETKSQLYTILLLQSDTFAAEKLLQKSQKFLKNFSKAAILEQKISKKRFQELKHSLLIALKEPAQNLDDLASRLNRNAFYYQDLNYYENLQKALSNLEYADFLSFIEQYFSKKNLQKAAIIAQNQKPVFLPKPYVLISMNRIKEEMIAAALKKQIPFREKIKQQATQAPRH